MELHGKHTVSWPTRGSSWAVVSSHFKQTEVFPSSHFGMQIPTAHLATALAFAQSGSESDEGTEVAKTHPFPSAWVIFA